MRVDERPLLRVAALGGGARHRLGEPVGAVGLRAEARVVGGFGDPWRMLVDAAEALDEQRACQLRRLPAAHRRMLDDPVAGDVEPGRDPRLFVAGDIVDESAPARRRAPGRPTRRLCRPIDNIFGAVAPSA